MKRAAIYARFSTDRQNERSADDQIDLCRAWAERQGEIIIVAEYKDEAVSGASTVNRLELGRLMRDARDQAFDVVICEALDRLSRDQADLATIRKQLAFLDIGISTVQDGVVGAMHIGLKGLMGELYLADVADKTRRGLRARVTQGASGGGRSYGYRATGQGAFEIDEAEAAVVRRIFAEYVKGRTPREIAARLNRDRVAGPRGGQWNASTINGSRRRANGVLQNRLYVGEIVWNRQRFIKDPATGKRVSRPNPESEWLRAPAPHLTIIDSGTFERAQAMKAEKGGEHPHKARKPRHLLSGLIRCGCCGGGFTIINRDRLGCSAVREKGTCDNRGSVSRSEIESRVLAALQAHLLTPEMVAEYVREYHAERTRLAKDNRARRRETVRKLGELERALDRGMNAILDGSAPAGLGLKLKGMEREIGALKSDLAGIDESPIQLHPKAAERYARIVADLRAHVEGMKRGEGAERVILEARKLIDRIEVGRMARNQPAPIMVTGALAELIDPKCRVKVVAGTRFTQPPTVVFAA